MKSFDSWCRSVVHTSATKPNSDQDMSCWGEDVESDDADWADTPTTIQPMSLADSVGLIFVPANDAVCAGYHNGSFQRINFTTPVNLIGGVEYEIRADHQKGRLLVFEAGKQIHEQPL